MCRNMLSCRVFRPPHDAGRQLVAGSLQPTTDHSSLLSRDSSGLVSASDSCKIGCGRGTGIENGASWSGGARIEVGVVDQVDVVSGNIDVVNSSNSSGPVSGNGISKVFDGSVDVDGLMQRAYGASLVTNVTYESGAVGLDFWFDCWNRVVHLRGLHYQIPGGAVRRKYVDMLNQEIMQLAAGNYSAERLVVFSCNTSEGQEC